VTRGSLRPARAGGAYFHAVQSHQPHRQEDTGGRPGYPADQGAEVSLDFRKRRQGDGPAGGRSAEGPRNHAAD
jgi:hypothetical protein